MKEICKSVIEQGGIDQSVHIFPEMNLEFWIP